MARTRVLPSLLLSGSRLVKTTRFRDPQYVGDPINAVRIFNEKEVDELLVLDIGAARERSRPQFALLKQIVSEAFMPVAYGGGVRSVEDAATLLQLGVEKVALNTATFGNLKLLSELAGRFGSQFLIGVVDVKKEWLRGYTVFSHAGERIREHDPVAWGKRLVEAGAGEVLVQSVDRDGTMSGYDLELLGRFDSQLEVPLLAAGGAGSVDDIVAALRACRLSGFAVGARFVYYGPHRAVLINYVSPDEMARIQRARRS